MTACGGKRRRKEEGGEKGSTVSTFSLYYTALYLLCVLEAIFFSIYYVCACGSWT